MIITQNKKSVVRSHDFQETACTIDAEDMRYVASLLRNNYSNPTFATIREVTANAVDANLEARAKKNVEVTIPTTINPVFSVRDFGGGLSPSDMIYLYSKFGKSTKRQSNNYIGGFGIGKFAPLSYGDSFSVVSYNNGAKVTYNVFIDENQDTKILKMDEAPSNEDSGLEIQVAVADEDVQNFREECLEFFRFFRESPTIKGLGTDKIKPLEKFLEGDAWFFIENDDRYSRRHGYNSTAIMGDVTYPIDPSAISGLDRHGDDANAWTLLQSESLYIRFPIGALTLHHSRESLEYSKPTQELIVNRIREIAKDMKEIATNKLKDAEDLWEAKKLYNSIVNTMDYSLRGIFKDAFSWKGIKIDCNYFTKERLPSSSYGNEDMTIRGYTKREDANVTDGYAVKSHKENYAYAQKGAMLAIDNVDSYHGGALRVRTIFNENEDVDTIYCIRFSSKAIKKQFYKEQNFDKVNKKRIFKFSEIEKAKVKRGASGVSYNKGNSRANISLFEFDLDASNHARNTDFWNDVSKDKELDEGIYVPIYNYRFINEGTKHEVMPLHSLNRVFKTLKSLKVKIPPVYGVRLKDVKKLKDTKLVHVEKFFMEKTKSLFAKEEVLQKIADNRAFSSNDGMNHDFNNLEGNGTFWKYCKTRLPKDSLMYKFLHRTCQVKSSINDEVVSYEKLLSYVGQFDKDFTPLLPVSKVNMKELRMKVYKAYPLAKHLSFYDWGGHKEDKEQGLEYVQQMDKLMKLNEINDIEKVA